MTPCAGSASQGQLPINILTIGEGLVFLRRVAGGPKQVPAVGYTLVLGGTAIHTNETLLKTRPLAKAKMADMVSLNDS